MTDIGKSGIRVFSLHSLQRNLTLPERTIFAYIASIAFVKQWVYKYSFPRSCFFSLFELVPTLLFRSLHTIATF